MKKNTRTSEKVKQNRDRMEIIRNKYNERKERDKVLGSKEYSDEQFKNFIKNHPLITIIWFSILGSLFQAFGLSEINGVTIFILISGFGLCIIASKTFADYVLEKFCKKKNALLKIILIVVFYLLISSFPFLIF